MILSSNCWSVVPSSTKWPCLTAAKAFSGSLWNKSRGRTNGLCSYPVLTEAARLRSKIVCVIQKNDDLLPTAVTCCQFAGLFLPKKGQGQTDKLLVRKRSRRVVVRNATVSKQGRGEAVTEVIDRIAASLYKLETTAKAAGRFFGFRMGLTSSRFYTGDDNSAIG